MTEKEKPTISLQMIVKDEVEQLNTILLEAVPYFDEINLTVSDKKACEALKKQWDKQPEVHIVHRPWNNRFDEARNENVAMSNCKYYFWIDSDDQFEFKYIPKLVQIAEAGQYDQILLPYDYARDPQGNTVAYHWRERLMRTSHPFTWKGWVHETPITNLPYKAHRVNIPVVHINGEEHTQESLQRNHAILLEATAVSDDPRYQLYLGTSFYSLGKYGEAVEVLDKFIKVSGNSEDIYRALCCMSECAVKMGSHNAGMQYAMQAAAQIPEYPQAYLLMAEWELDQGNNEEALEWAKVSLSKPEPKGLGVFDPSARDQTYLVGTYANLKLRNWNQALKWLRNLKPDHPARLDMEEEILAEADAETFITLLPKFRKYFNSEKDLYTSLVYDLRYDVRLRGLRDIVEEPKTWDDNSIVILVGEGYEEWGPHTLDKGMGGSEEAVVYLTRELAKLGWNVTVYGAVERPITYNLNTKGEWTVLHGDLVMKGGSYVKYLPWREINKSDNFNVFVAWRAPEFTEHIKAKVKVADIHDILNKSSMKDYADVTYFVKSNFHRELYPDLADNKFRVIGNGIQKDQFNV